jgi:hypothetical protein
MKLPFFGALSLLLMLAFVKPVGAQMSQPVSVEQPTLAVSPTDWTAPTSVGAPNMYNGVYLPIIQMEQNKWQSATRFKWFGYFVSVVSLVGLTNNGGGQGLAALGIGGSIAYLAGFVTEEVHKHRYTRAVSQHLLAMDAQMSALQNPTDEPQPRFDFLIPPANFRSSSLEDLKKGSLVWFQHDDGPVLLEGEIVSTTARGERLYVMLQSNGTEHVIPMGDVYIPLQD